MNPNSVTIVAVPTTALETETQNPEQTAAAKVYDTTRAFVPTNILLSIKVNQNWMHRLRSAGIVLTRLTQKQQHERIFKHAEEAKQIGRDAWRGQRVDSTRVRQADSGTPVFGWDKAGSFAICPVTLTAGLEQAFGMKIVNISLSQKPNDVMYKLLITYAAEGTPFKISNRQNDLLLEVLGRAYEHGHIFRNPSGTVTINLAHALVDLQSLKEFRIMVFEDDGSFRTEKYQR